MRRILNAFLLIFAFLFAQGGMSVHAVSHVAAAGQTNDDGGLPHEPACDLCASYAQLSGAAPLPDALPMPGNLAGQELPRQSVPVFSGRLAFHSLARAPPLFS